MAAIDKTYVHDYDTWKELYDYAGEVAPFGIKGFLRNFCYGPYTKEDFEDNNYGRCLWNTPTYVDVWLAENCTHEAVVNTLNYQYGEDEYEEMASGEYTRKRNLEKGSYRKKRFANCYPDGEVYFTISKDMDSHKRMSRGSFYLHITDDATGEKWMWSDESDFPGPVANSENGYNYFRFGNGNTPEYCRYKKNIIRYKGNRIVYHKFVPHQFNKHFVYNILRQMRLKPGLTIKITFDSWVHKNMAKRDKTGGIDNRVWRDTMIVHTKYRRTRHNPLA